MNTNTTTATNQIELREVLLEEIAALRDGSVTPERVNAVSHASNIVLKSITQQINYAVQRGERPFVEFLSQEKEQSGAAIHTGRIQEEVSGGVTV